jgi:uncharacterized protein HemX
MSVRAARSAAPRRPAERARPRPAAPGRPRPRALPGGAGRAWRLPLGRLLIPVLTLALGGIVWVNVAKLTLTTQATAVTERARAVEAEAAQLEARLAQQEARVIQLARARGMVPVPSDGITFLQAPDPR